MDKRLILLLGGARSGKSAYAEKWAEQHGEQVLFVATAQAFDDEMRERIANHRASRPAHWHTLEAPTQVGKAIQAYTHPVDTVVLDCMTLLISNIVLQLPDDATEQQADAAAAAEVEALLAAYEESSATWLVISNEVGMGIVPAYKLGRLYRDVLGRVNQQLARQADDVHLLVAGLSWQLKPVTS